jgi:hypothetical protein
MIALPSVARFQTSASVNAINSPGSSPAKDGCGLPVTRLKRLLTTRPCTRGSVPVPSVACPTLVSVGIDVTRVLANQAPSRRSLMSVGINSAWVSK